MASLEIHWNKAKLNKEIGKSEEVYEGIAEATNRFGSAANAMCSGFRSERVLDYKKKEWVGGTQAHYDYNIERNGSDKWPIGLVWPANYAAWKDLLKNDTLLKVVGNG